MVSYDVIKVANMKISMFQRDQVENVHLVFLPRFKSFETTVLKLWSKEVEKFSVELIQ